MGRVAEEVNELWMLISSSNQSLLNSAEAWTRSLFDTGGPHNWSCISMTKGWWQLPHHGWIKVEAQALLEGLNQIVRDNNRVANYLAREAQGDMKELFIHGEVLRPLSEIDDLSSTFSKLNTTINGPRGSGIVGDRGSREGSSVAKWPHGEEVPYWLGQQALETESDILIPRAAAKPTFF
ncbi:hypothetical protein GOBAR_DD25454 [Gossypium barbadense]|nr:hypothetical protein GOBAR_DD25454 [Gossypium barbadense]